jgi:hypothetical protein
MNLIKNTFKYIYIINSNIMSYHALSPIPSAPPAYNNYNYYYNHNIISNLQLPPPPPKKTKGTLLKNVIEKYDIDPSFSENLGLLEDFKIIFLCDDSTSMNTSINGSNITRWDEVKTTINIVFEIASIFSKNGIDLYFLNRPGRCNIKNYSTISNLLDEPPCGRTPLTNKCQKIFKHYNENNKKILLLIATDGVPTNNYDTDDSNNFLECLKKRNHNKNYISFLVCSNNKNEISYLNKLYRSGPNIDILDDYVPELKEVIRVRGRSYRYSLGTHITRLLLGPICPKFYNFYETKLNKCLCNIM